jgi:catechol 2,3-dioxygenase-like lactoylglutathione lyase family enzyme
MSRHQIFAPNGAATNQPRATAWVDVAPSDLRAERGSHKSAHGNALGTSLSPLRRPHGKIRRRVSPIRFESSRLGGPMSDAPEPEPLTATGTSGLDLFMTVVRVADWPTTVRWYVEKLGLEPVLLDPAHEFAFLAAGSGRVGFKGMKDPRSVYDRTRVRLVFEVPDVGRERDRLTDQGVKVSAPFDNQAEGYREIRLHDPEGNSLTLFTWLDPEREQRFSRNRS